MGAVRQECVELRLGVPGMCHLHDFDSEEPRNLGPWFGWFSNCARARLTCEAPHSGSPTRFIKERNSRLDFNKFHL